MLYKKEDCFLPPIKKFNKESIIEVAYNIAMKDGLESINARRIASILHSSVNPIFNNFKNMEELKKEVYNKIYELYKSYMLREDSSENKYKQTGLNYIKFAKDYTEFFKIIFMQATPLNVEKFIMADDAGNDVIKKGQKLTGFSFEEQKKFHSRVWIFTHGIACLVATNTVNLSDEEISELLETTVRQMIIGYKKEKENENEKNNRSKKLNERV